MGFRLLILAGLWIGWFSQALPAQPLALGQWRSHFTFFDGQQVFLAGDAAYLATPNSLFSYENGELTPWVKASPLSEASVTALAKQEKKGRVVIGYANGNLDWFREGEKVNFPAIKEANRAGDKAIYDIFFRGDTAYVASGVGMIMLQLRTEKVLETWLQLGKEAGPAAIYRGLLKGDSVFLATSVGLMANTIDFFTNRQDWQTWQRFSLPGVSDGLSVRQLAESYGVLFASTGNNTLYRYRGKGWVQDRVFTRPIVSLRSGKGGELLVVTNDTLFVRNASSDWEPVMDPSWGLLRDARLDESGTYWLADAENGLVWGNDGAWQSTYPSGPPSNFVADFAGASNTMYAVPGGFSGGTGQQLPGQTFFWSGTEWSSLKEESLGKDWSGIALNPNQDSLVVAAFGHGVGVFPVSGGSPKLYVEPDEGPFVPNVGEPPLRFSDVAFDGLGNLWAVQHQGSGPLYRRSIDGQWTRFTLKHPRARFAEKVLPSAFGYILVSLAGYGGGGLLVFDPERDTTVFVDQSNGLPNDYVQDMVEDSQGLVWTGGADGVGIITNLGSAFNAENINVERPRVDFREAFVGVAVTSFVLDGGDRLWIGSSQGVWLLDGLGGGLIAHFTKENSLMPANSVTALGMIPNTGEIFIHTTQGTVSYQGDAPVGGKKHSDVKVFPNPVSPSFVGKVAILGVPRAAYLQVTDLAGNRIRELRSNGGLATWDLNDLYGERVPAGVYLLVTISPDGQEGEVSRVVVTE